MKERDSNHYSIRLLAVLTIIAVFVTPSIIARPPIMTLNGETHPVSSDLEQPPIKIDPQLKSLMNHQTDGNVKVIALLGTQADIDFLKRVIGSHERLKVLTTFKIIPALLIEGPLSGISELISVKEIRSLYLNKEIRITPINKTAELIEFMSVPQSLMGVVDLPPSNMANGSGVKISIADSGIDSTHPDLTGKVVAAQSFVNSTYGYLDNDTSLTDDLGHGTYVAGIAAGTGALLPELRGVAPQARLLSAKCVDNIGRAFTAGIIKAIEWSVDNGADVISLSLGGGSADPDDPISLAADNAARSGVVVVAAAGNSGPYYSTGETPAAARLAISVGAYNETNSIASFSSRGPTVDGRPYPDIVAPGVNVWSTLASSSSISDYASRLGLNSGMYVPLDGTSAAAPFVSGAAALLLSAMGLSQLNRSYLPVASRLEIPTTIRIALMHTAKSLGTDVNTQGSGLMDVDSAYNYLLGFGNRLHYPIVEVYPKQLISPPYLVGYLGESLDLGVSVLTAFKANLTVEVSGNATSFIRLGNTSLTNIAGLTVLSANVSIPVNATLGRYLAQIGFQNVSTHEFIMGQNITVSLSVKNPKGRLYFDLFHTDYTFSTKSAYYKLASTLASQGYSVHESGDPITYSKLSEYDALILTVPRVMFGLEEANAIERFVEHNGSLLVLGTYYPMAVAESINDITAKYGIQYAKNFIANYSDLVFARGIVSMINVTDFSNHPVAGGLKGYMYGYGSTLAVSTPATSVAFTPPGHGNLTVLAACDIPKGGRIVASGSMLFASDDYLQSSSYPGNLKLTENIFSWLLGKANASIESIAPKSRVKTGELFQIGVAVTNRTTGELLPSTVSCIADNGTKIPINLEKGIQEIYYNTTLRLQSQGLYVFNVNATVVSSGLKIIGAFTIEVIDAPPNILNVTLTSYNNPVHVGQLPTVYRSFLPDGAPMILRYGDYVNFTIGVSGLTQPDSNVTVYLTRSPSFYIANEKPLTYVSLKATRIGSTDYYYAQYRPSITNTTDVYQYWISANNDGYTSTSSMGGSLMVASVDPQIAEATTIINARPLSDLRSPQDGSVLIYPMTVKTGDTIPVVINGSDAEDDINQMRAWVILLDPSLYIVPGLISAELIVSQIPFDSATQTFRGNLSIPLSGNASLPFEPTQISLLNELLYMLIVLADSDGAYSADFAGVYVIQSRQTIPTEVIFLVLAVSMAVPVLLILILNRRNREKRSEVLPPDYYSPHEPKSEPSLS